jgi:hypothetical protein
VFAFLDSESEIDPLVKTGKTLEVVHVELSPSSLSSDVSSDVLKKLAHISFVCVKMTTCKLDQAVNALKVAR